MVFFGSADKYACASYQTDSQLQFMSTNDKNGATETYFTKGHNEIKFAWIMIIKWKAALLLKAI
jgi:hypothetical protein